MLLDYRPYVLDYFEYFATARRSIKHNAVATTVTTQLQQATVPLENNTTMVSSAPPQRPCTCVVAMKAPCDGASSANDASRPRHLWVIRRLSGRIV